MTVEGDPAPTDDTSEKDIEVSPSIPMPAAPVRIPGQPYGIEVTAQKIDATRERPVHTAALEDDLKAHRTQITMAHLAGDFAAAFDLLLYQLARQVLSPFYFGEPAVSASFVKTHLSSSLDDLKETPAARLLRAHEEHLPGEWLNAKPDESFKLLCALPEDDKRALFAYCVAQTLKPCLGDSSTPMLEQTGARLEIDIASFWRPHAENYWLRVNKQTGLAAAASVVSETWANERRDEKKAVLAKTLAALFATGNVTGLEPSGLARAQRWLPRGMGFDGPGNGGADDNRTDDPVEPLNPTLSHTDTAAVEQEMADDNTPVDVGAVASNSLPAFLATGF